MSLDEDVKEVLIAIEEKLMALEKSPEQIELVSQCIRDFKKFEAFKQIGDISKLEITLYHAECLFWAVLTRDLVLNDRTISLLFNSLELIWQVLSMQRPENFLGEPTLMVIEKEEEKSDQTFDENLLQQMLDENKASMEKEKESTEQSSTVQPLATNKVNANASNEVESAVVPETKPKPESKAKSDVSIKVDSVKLDRIMFTLQELVMRYAIMAQKGRDDTVFEIGKIVDELHSQMIDLQRVSINPMFLRMKRLVKDLATKTGKKIDFVVEGEQLQADKNLLEQLQEPLVHLLRNSCDHGIENEATRLEAGKEPAGVVTLRAFTEGDYLMIAVSDDGQGINTERILQKALSLNLVTKSRNYSHQEILQMIFHPGFSTSEKVTDISGRGVGMDVVRQKLTKLGGDIELQSTLGKGSSFVLRLPFNNMLHGIFKGVVAKVGDHLLAIPIQSIREIVSWDDLEGMLINDHSVSYQGDFINILDLRPIFNLPAKEERDALIIENDSFQRCIITVDRVIGEQQVVSRQFNSYVQEFPENKFVYGMGFSGEDLALVLDTDKLLAV